MSQSPSCKGMLELFLNLSDWEADLKPSLMLFNDERRDICQENDKHNASMSNSEFQLKVLSFFFCCKQFSGPGLALIPAPRHLHSISMLPVLRVQSYMELVMFLPRTTFIASDFMFSSAFFVKETAVSMFVTFTQFCEFHSQLLIQRVRHVFYGGPC